MKLLIFFFVLVTTCSVTAQLKSGFDANEARAMIQICNSFTYLDLYGSDIEILPAGYKKVYTSPVYGMDNKFQIYTNGNKGVIHFRGSTSKQSSWLENLYASMIPVKSKILINGKEFEYQVGENRESHIHAGYMLAVCFFKDDLLKQVKELNKEGIYNICITGHSQGGALAQIVRAYLSYLPEKELSAKNNFKVYAFANPMIGNPSFVKEYNEKFCEPGMSYLIHNPADFVPRLPVSYNDSTFWKENLSDIILNREEFSIQKTALEGGLYLFKDKVSLMVRKMSQNIEKQLIKELGEIVMPAFYEDVNYVHTGNRIMLSPTEYPLELKDSSILQSDSLMRIYKRDENGIFEDKDLYKQPGKFLQHKTYNYYTAVLKAYFPEAYDQLGQKYFVMPEKVKR